MIKKLKYISTILFVSLIIALSVFVLVRYYSFIFSKTITGVIQKVERLETPLVVSNTGATGSAIPPQAFSFSISIVDNKSGEIILSTSEDRQWAVVEAGQCASVRVYPYPPWELNKSGTLHNARVLNLYKSCEDFESK